MRGATSVEVDEREHVLAAVRELVAEVVDRNGLSADQLISMIFTATPDVRSVFPAFAARALGYTDVPLLCATEIDVPGATPRVVRLLAHVETDRPAGQIAHVYLRGAAGLRPDLAL